VRRKRRKEGEQEEAKIQADGGKGREGWKTENSI
jgi:hypothetical protein